MVNTLIKQSIQLLQQLSQFKVCGKILKVVFVSLISLGQVINLKECARGLAVLTRNRVQLT
jgi:hypothetical protein